MVQKNIVNLTLPDGIIEPYRRTIKTLIQKARLINNKGNINKIVKLPSVRGYELQILKSKLSLYESKVDHMYLDSQGYVTIGVGHLIATLSDAEKLPFKNKVIHKNATKDEIKTEFEKLDAMDNTFGFVSRYYKDHTNLYLSSSDIDVITTKHIFSFNKELNSLYPDFKNYSTYARLALFDMIFNLGMTKLRKQYPRMNKHVKNRDWIQAGNESRRHKIAIHRNTYVRELFYQAIEAEFITLDQDIKVSAIC